MEIYKEAFLDYLKVEKGLSRNTILSYGQDLKKYFEYLKEKNILDFLIKTLRVLRVK